MTIKEILHYPHPMLSRSTDPVTVFDESISTLSADLRETAKMFNAEGLAATQVGEAVRMFVIKDGDDYITCVNPDILSVKKELTNSNEGCLSFPGVHENIKRFDAVHVRYQDESGQETVRWLSGVPAVAFQHERDHLNGIVFTAHMGKLQRHMALKRLAKVSKVTKRNAAHFQKLLTQELRKVELAKAAEPATV